MKLSRKKLRQLILHEMKHGAGYPDHSTISMRAQISPEEQDLKNQEAEFQAKLATLKGMLQDELVDSYVIDTIEGAWLDEFGLPVQDANHLRQANDLMDAFLPSPESWHKNMTNVKDNPFY